MKWEYRSGPAKSKNGKETSCLSYRGEACSVSVNGMVGVMEEVGHSQKARHLSLPGNVAVPAPVLLRP